jgi:hypothetical protein
MVDKKRLGSTRQGFVLVLFVTPISCVSLVWITGTIDARTARFDNAEKAGAHNAVATAGGSVNAAQGWGLWPVGRNHVMGIHNLVICSGHTGMKNRLVIS